MKPLLIITFCFLLFACNKNKEKPQEETQNELLMKLQAHHWLMDSLKIHQQDSIYTIIERDPSLEVYFTNSKMIIQAPSSTPDERYYWLEEPNKIYDYKTYQSKDQARYFFVDTVTDKLLILRAVNNNNNLEYDYHHAK